MVVILQWGRVKCHNGAHFVSNSFGSAVSKFFINDDVNEIAEYRKSLVQKCLEDPKFSHPPYGISNVWTLEEDFLSNTPFTNVGEICEIEKEMAVIVLATVKSVLTDKGWQYLGCTRCTSKVTVKSVTTDKEDGTSDYTGEKVFLCTGQKCIKAPVTTASPRFRLELAIQDVTGSAILTLFDRDAIKLFRKSAKEMLESSDEVMNMGALPEEINTLIDKKFAFKVEVTEYNFKFSSDTYTISKLTDDPDVLLELEKQAKKNQPIESESLDITMSDIPSSIDIGIKAGTMAVTDDNTTPLSKTERTSSNGKDLDAETPTQKSDDKALKRQLVEVYDVDEHTSMSTTKKGSGSKEVKLLIPKLEK